MNADKTDISNTNRPRNQTPGTTLPEEKSKEIQLESQSAGDLHAKKQRSAGKQKIRDIKEITKSLSDGSSINPTGEQKFTTGSSCHKRKSVGEMEKSRDSCRGILSINWETRVHCTSKNC
jgi:hypothetical protein